MQPSVGQTEPRTGPEPVSRDSHQECGVAAIPPAANLQPRSTLQRRALRTALSVDAAPVTEQRLLPTLTCARAQISVFCMPNSPSAPSSAGAAATVNRGTVLIADDDPEILTLLSIRLSKRGYTVLEAADGLQTLQVARGRHPDLVLLDVMMPGKNGWEVARELRGDQTLSDIGIVMLTAIGEKVNEMTSPLYGADDYIDKPFNFEELERKIAAVIEQRRRGRK